MLANIAILEPYWSQRENKQFYSLVHVWVESKALKNNISLNILKELSMDVLVKWGGQFFCLIVDNVRNNCVTLLSFVFYVKYIL